jgi:hypothetical protein
MGWASGFAAGTQMARGWIDTYKDVKESTGRGLANQEILAAQQERERQMQQAVTPGISSGPEQNMSPSATPTTAATPAQNKLPMPPSAGGLGTPPQMSPVTLATPDLINAVQQVESGGRVNAVSRAGARGVMQVMPATAGDPGYGVKPAQDDSVEENIRLGTDYLNAMLAKYNGDVDMALSAYNQGPGATDRWIAEGADPAKIPGGKETRDYAGRVRAALGTSSPTSVDGQRTIQDVIAKDQRPAQPAGDGSQRRTGLGNLDAEIAKEAEVLDIYRKYNLRDEIASQEKKISGLKSAYEEKSRYERDSDIAAEQRAYEQRQDEITNNRLEAQQTASQALIAQQIEQSEFQLGAARTKQFFEDLDRDADNAIRLATVNGRPLSDIATEVPEAYREKPDQWQSAIAKQYMVASGLKTTDFGQIIKSIVSPIDQLLNTKYTTEEAKVDAYNEKLAALDPDASDDLFPKLFPKEDGSWGLTYGNVTIMEGATPEDIAQKYKAGVLADPYGHALDRIDFLRVKALKDARKLTTAKEKQDFLIEMAENNPAIIKDQTLKDQLLEAVGFGNSGIDATNTRWKSAISSLAGYARKGEGGLTAVETAAAELANEAQKQKDTAATAQQELRAKQDNAAAATPQIIFALAPDGIEETFGGDGIKPSRLQSIALQVRKNGGDLQDYEATIRQGLGGNLVIGGANTDIRTVD